MISLLNNRVFVLTCLFFSVGVLVIYAIVSNIQFKIEYDWPMGKSGVRYILFWEQMWIYKDFGLGLGGEIFKNCAVKNCYTTRDKHLIPIEQFDALVFHGVEYVENPSHNPPIRDHKQVYIYMNLETTYNTPTHLRYSYGFFNWTMTYR